MASRPPGRPGGSGARAAPAKSASAASAPAAAAAAAGASPGHPEDRALVEAYLDTLIHRRRLAANTITNYTRNLERLLALLGETRLAALDGAQARRLVARLHAGGLAPRALAAVLSAWRGLFHWLVRHRGYAANPVQGVRAPRAPRNLPKALSVEAAQRLLEVEPDDARLQADPELLRDLAMFELLYSSGLRRAELAGLDVHDGALDLAAGEVRVTGKGGRTRTVPVGSRARQALHAWLQVRGRLAHAEERALFVGARGRRISFSGIAQRLAAWARRQGMEGKVHPHMLRHSFASHVLQSSQDLRAVQEMLGHASIAATQIYTHLDFQALARVYDAAHPRARKK
ncbi:MAG: tyrosine recombinase XerC [Betaproteobacteria bacterium]|nr:tyrosine recombinase XerC [Betaproteobacteria bacterium]